MQPLARAHLPRVLQLTSPTHCALPRGAVARTVHGGGQPPHSGDEVPLAGELLARVQQGGRELLQQAGSQSHAQLWTSLSEAPLEVVKAQGLLLSASACLVVGMPAQELGPRHCAHLLMACARLLPHVGLDDRGPMLHHLTGCLVQLLPQARLQDLTDGLHALAELHRHCGHTPSPKHLEGLAAGVLQRLSGQEGRSAESLAPGPASSLLRSCSILGCGQPELLTRLAQAAGEGAAGMDPRELCSSIRALGVLVEAGRLDGSSGVPGVQRLADEARNRASEFAPLRTYKLLYGLAQLQTAAQPGVYRFAPTAEALAAEWPKVGGFQGLAPHVVARTAWALAVLDYGGHAWYDACAAAARQPSFYATATRRDWSDLWWALAKVLHRPADAPVLLARMADGSAAPVTQAKARHCHAIVHAFATLGLYDRRLVGGLLGRLAELLARKEASVHTAVTAVWSVAVMGPEALSALKGELGPLLRGVASSWQDPCARAALRELHLGQLWSVQVELEAHPDPQVRALAGILSGCGDAGAGLLAAMEQVVDDLPLSTHRVTARVRGEVVGTLLRMQERQQQQGSAVGSSGDRGPGASVVAVAEGVFVRPMCSWVHVEVRFGDGRAAAVLLDSPRAHRLANLPHVRQGGAQLRYRQLERVYGEGNVVGVSGQEWEALGGDMGRQEELLRALLLQGGGE